MTPISKLPQVGTTIFTVMSQMAMAHGAVNLGQGFPDFECPAGLQEALFRHVRAGHNQYAPMTGVRPLREQIARKTLELYGAQVDVETDITVTSGATEALFAAIASVVGAGDEVIVLDPCYDSYDPAIALQGARAVHIPLHPEHFSVDWQRVADAITPRTRMIMINTPHNPSGAVLQAEDLAQLAALVRDTGIYVISDEVYEHIIFDGVAHQSVLRYPELAARSFVISSFGKTYHVTGWKTGYCIAPPALSAEFRKVHQYLTFSGFTPVQFAIADFLASDPAHYHELPAFYQDKRDQFRALLAGSRLRLLPVPGGYFQLADYRAIRDVPDQEFAAWLCKEHQVAAIPVSAFYETPPDSRLIRFCFAKRPETLQAAAERLVAL